MSMWMLLIVLAAALGLFLVVQRRNPARRLAAAEGWRYEGMDQFSGKVGDSDWRGGAHQDDDSGACWTDFQAGVPGLSPGGFVIVSSADWQQSLAKQRERESGAQGNGLLARADAALDSAFNRLTGGLFDEADDPADDRRRWQVLDVGSAAFRAGWVLLASDDRWGAVLTPVVESRWLALHPTSRPPASDATGGLHVHGQHYRLSVRRDDGRMQAKPDDVAALLRLGVELLQATRAAALR